MTPLGYILLPIGLAALLFSKRWLYRLFVFWTLFSASSALNVGEGENGSALQVWMLFGFLWIIRLIAENLSLVRLKVDGRIARPCLWLIAFLCIASASLIMPVYINGTMAISSPSLANDSETPLFLTSHSFTQLLYLIFGGTIAICVAHSNMRDRDRHETEQIILLSGLFIALWGLVQFFCNITGAAYPDYIFNNSGSASGKGFLETLDGVGRVCSVATEPAVFAQALISLLPLTLAAWLRKGSVLSPRIDRACAVLFVVLLLVCTSSIGYLGLLILGILLLPLLWRTHTISALKALKIAAMVTAALTALVVVSVSSIPVVSDVINSALLNKATAGSGVERGMTIVLAFGYFQKFPLLGIGWGSATSHDLLVKLLSNVGVVGTFTFLGTAISVLRGNWRSLKPLLTADSLSRAAWFLALAIFLSTSLFNEFPLAFGNFWLVLGMAISTSPKSELAPESLFKSEIPKRINHLSLASD